MIDLDGDRMLDLFGIVLALGIVGGFALLGLGAVSVQEGSTPAPEADWTLERVNGSHVRVIHAGGEPVRSEHLSVAVDGQHRRVQWTATTLVDGGYGIVRADERAAVTLLWQRSEGDRRVLERWRP